MIKRCQIIGLFNADCTGVPLGMEDGTITDGQITASSVDTIGQSNFPNVCCRPWYARLNHGTKWRPSRDKTNPNSWIRIDLRENRTVTGLIAQGWSCWVKTLYVKYEHPPGSGQLEYIYEAGDDHSNIKVNVSKIRQLRFNIESLTIRWHDCEMLPSHDEQRNITKYHIKTRILWTRHSLCEYVDTTKRKKVQTSLGNITWISILQ